MNSAHGNQSGTVNGVYRTEMDQATGFGYAQGNCAHCHELHASVEGAEPTPPTAEGPADYALFYENFKTQTDGLCLQCHIDGLSRQSGGTINNYSYSYQAGGWAADAATVNSIFDSFSYSYTTPPNSSHYLADIKAFIDNDAFGWGYSDNPNPCAACHNPHAAQKDDKTGTRGWPLSRPSEHNLSPWPLWGADDTSERMDDYTANFQASYRFNTTQAYEPDASTTTDGSNLTDFVTFCSDCHDDVNNPSLTSITSTPLSRSLFTVDWTSDKHGTGFDSGGSVCLDNPYDPGGTPALSINHVLSCMDCHESHGSPNAYILRPEVNGAVLGTTLQVGSPATPTGTAVGSTTSWQYLCNRCHKDDSEIDPTNCSTRVNSWFIVHHDNTVPNGCNDGLRPYIPAGCGTCHSGGPFGPALCTTSVNQINCDGCHFHGATNAGRGTF